MLMGAFSKGGTSKKLLLYSGEEMFVNSQGQKRNLAGLNERFNKAEKIKPETELGFLGVPKELCVGDIIFYDDGIRQ